MQVALIGLGWAAKTQIENHHSGIAVVSSVFTSNGAQIA
jgi:hypothetical protein